MVESKLDIIRIVLQPYVLDILHALENEPKRFVELKKYVRSEMTLSSKLSRLLKYGLIEIVPLKTERRYMNAYIISKKGKEIVKKLEKI